MISFFLSLIIFLINGVSVLRFYQIKDYLLKRCLAHFYLPSSKKLFLNKKEYFLYFLLALSFFLIFLGVKEPKFSLDFLIFLVILFFVLRFNFFKKIHFTPKATLVTFLVLLFNFSLLYILNNNRLIALFLTLWPSQFIIFTISISVFDFAIKPYLNFLGKKVKEKLEKNKDLKIIGIVGSYGKSSTKEFLVQLLKKKYKVISPGPRINHEYAILKFLLNVKLDGFDYLILEFGSYYLGNVKFITKYVTPEIAFITGITKQHLFLFGNIENIIKGEGTEILTWMKKGILFVNKNHEYFEKLKSEIEKIKSPEIKVYFYGDFKILEQNLEKTIFKFKDKVFETKIIFPMQVENLVGVLSYLELINNLEDYKNEILNLELPEGFLKLKIKENLYIFDDSYNANPRGVFEALKFFKNLDFDYKIIIFNGLFELGRETEEIYKKLAQEFSSFDKIILTSTDYYEIFKEILKDQILLVKSSKELKIFLQSLKNKKVGLWIFNRFPERIKFQDEEIN